MRLSESERYSLLHSFETEAAQQGFQWVAGLDEAGRGPLAGPVAAAAVILDPQQPILGLNDSKKLSENKREQLFEQIQRHALAFSVVMIDSNVIDAINILEATKRAMRQAVTQLSVKPDLLLIDAIRLDGLGIPIWPIIGGDAKSNSIAAASILAKVTRDHLMVDLDRQFPGYGFAKHKGYGTAAHYDAIRQLGLTPVHRRSFLKNLSEHGC